MNRVGQQMLLVALAGLLLGHASADTCSGLNGVSTVSPASCTSQDNLYLTGPSTPNSAPVYCSVNPEAEGNFGVQCTNVASAVLYYGPTASIKLCNCDSDRAQISGYMFYETTNLKYNDTTASQYECTVCFLPTTQTSQGDAGADPIVSGFDGTEWFLHAEHGRPLALLSGPDHALNTEIGTLLGATGDFNDEWLMAVAVRYQDITVEVRIDVGDEVLEVYHDADSNHASHKRMRVQNGSLPLELRVNGVLHSDKLYSGQPLETGNKDVLLYMAAVDAINPNDAYDGPIFIMKTPDWEITTYLESEDALHLDVTHKIISANVQPHCLHGVLGQTLAWKQDDIGDNIQPHNHTMLGSAEDYFLADGLTGTNFKHSQFCWPKCEPETRAEMRKLATGLVDFTGSKSGIGRH